MSGHPDTVPPEGAGPSHGAVLPSTWKLLRETVDVLLEATPKNVDLDQFEPASHADHEHQAHA
jgi:Co/Zn/Cd efflux system component